VSIETVDVVQYLILCREMKTEGTHYFGKSNFPFTIFVFVCIICAAKNKDYCRDESIKI